jgi:hypothetical protein
MPHSYTLAPAVGFFLKHPSPDVLLRGGTAVQVPYFIWASIATVLQLAITWMNRA